jgi:hypothetical protein
VSSKHAPKAILESWRGAKAACEGLKMASKERDRQIAAALHPEAVGVGFADQAAFGSKFTVIHWLGENR